MSSASHVDFHVIIPVRYDSKRLPGKPLLEIEGKPLVQHVYERGVESCASSVIIATDSIEIKEVAESFGARVCMTSSDHPSGTDRLAEAVEALGYDKDDVVVNLQGDEPMISPHTIQAVARDLTIHDNVGLATVACPIQNAEELLSPHVVKVVLNKRGFAMYFSRAPIPWDRDEFANNPDSPAISPLHYRHVGIYSYRVGFLQQYLAWEQSDIGGMESLEQLRVLWNAQRIHVVVEEKPVTPGIDTEEDLERIRAIFADQTK